jgi:hypothetical protein
MDSGASLFKIVTNRDRREAEAADIARRFGNRQFG